MRYLPLALALLAGPAAAQSPPPGWCTYWIQLRDEVLSVSESGAVTGPDRERWERIEQTVLRALFEDGWPDSEDGCGLKGVVVTLAATSSPNAGFQERVLPFFQLAAENGPNNDKTTYALVTDRLRVNSEEPQVYGTITDCSDSGEAFVIGGVEDLDEIDALRSQMGLRQTLDEWLTQASGYCSNR